jgi:hypothetical protein
LSPHFSSLYYFVSFILFCSSCRSTHKASSVTEDEKYHMLFIAFNDLQKNFEGLLKELKVRRKSQIFVELSN